MHTFLICDSSIPPGVLSLIWGHFLPVNAYCYGGLWRISAIIVWGLVTLITWMEFRSSAERKRESENRGEKGRWLQKWREHAKTRWRRTVLTWLLSVVPICMKMWTNMNKITTWNPSFKITCITINTMGPHVALLFWSDSHYSWQCLACAKDLPEVLYYLEPKC